MKTKVQFLSIAFICLLSSALISPRQAYAQPNYSFQNWCQIGGQPVMLAGLPSTTVVQQSFPSCTVSVYLTGTFTLAPIFSDKTGTVKGNPFTANSDASFLFYAAPSVALDITISGGGMPAPRTYVGVIVSTSGGSGGALFPSTPAVVVNTSTLASRNAVFGDIVGLFASGTCVGFLKNDGTCGAAGGGGTPAGSPFNAQFNNAGSFGGSAATFDALGNFKSLSNDGLKNAFLKQTTPTSNNGIANALASGGQVVAGPDYATVEGFFGGSSTCIGTNWRDAIGCPAPFANSSYLLDLRAQVPSSYAYNVNPASGGGFAFIDRWVSNQQAQASGGGNTVTPYLRDFEMSGSGKNGFEGGGPDSFLPFWWNFEYMRRGIVSAINIQETAPSIGDDHVIQITANVIRGSTDGAGEGFNTIRNAISQNLTPVAVTATTTLVAGATLIPGTYIAGTNALPGDGTYDIDATKGGPLFNITGVTQADNGTAGTAGTWTVSATLTPDNIGRVATFVNTPKQYYGATTPETVTITGLAHTLCVGDNKWNGSACVAFADPTGPVQATVCYADKVYQESARVISLGSFSGGTQTATIALRYVHQANAYVSQGSHACNVVEAKANQVTGTYPGRQLFRMIGVSGIHTILISRTAFGNWAQAPSGFFLSTPIALAGATITRNASNVASVAVSDPFQIFTGDAAIVSGCVDTSFNTTKDLLSDNGTSVTWPSTGPAGTTTCTNDIEILSRMSSQGVRQAQEFPGAEIVNTNDPVTFAINYKFTVEPNTNFQVTAGDVLEDQVYSDVSIGLDHSVIDFSTQTAPGIGNITHADQLSGEIPEGINWWRVSFIDDPIHYQGKGGTKVISNTLFEMGNNLTPFNNLFDNLPAPKTSAFTFSGCLFGCADARSSFQLFLIPTNGGNYIETIYQDTGKMERTTSNATNNLTVREKPTDFDVILNGSGNGDVLTIAAGEYKNTVGGGAGTSSVIDQTSANIVNTINGTLGAVSHVIQSLTGWSVDVPVTIVGTANGCASFTSGVLGSTAAGCPITGSITTTAALTDVITVTGMTASGHCAAPGPTNAAAGTMIQNATPVFIDTFTTNAITLHHVATAGASFSFVCTSN